VSQGGGEDQAAGAPATAQDAALYDEAVETLAARYWNAFLALRPTVATTVGDERFDDRLEDPSPAGQAAFRDLHAGTLAELDAIDALRPAEGSAGGGSVAGVTEGAVTADVLRFMCESTLELEDTGWPLLEAVDQQDGPQALLPILAPAQPSGTPERLERWIARLDAYPAFIDAYVARIQEGASRGVTPARVVAERVAAQLERMLAEPAERSVLVTAAAADRQGDRETLVAAVERSIRPANARLLAAVRDVLPATRTAPGLSSVSGGAAMYAARAYRWTTIRANPAELHEWGNRELAEIEAARRAIADAAGHGDDTAGYRRALATDPANVPASREALLGRMREDLERALATAPKWFGRLPRAACEIEAIDASLEADALGYYIQPPADGSRPGVFSMNTSDLPKRLFTRFATVTYHETIPGHHFQLATEVELPGLSRFRREGASQVCGSFVEGWGLYAERLADEMGLFRSAGERFGMLDAQAWRAARLVIDTGIHAFGWDREQAVDLFVEATGFDRSDAEIEVDRYVAVPAQALAYKTGQREITRLRAEAAAAATAAGAAFDLRRFHDELLGHGSLPLPVLAAHLPAWLAAV
jgi:uncharacterized protein (DUF885 family)